MNFQEDLPLWNIWRGKNELLCSYKDKENDSKNKIGIILGVKSVGDFAV